MGNFVQQAINGLTLGAIYGLIALGYTMVFGILGMINFAHGSLFMISTFISLLLSLFASQYLGLSLSLPVLGVIIILAMGLTSVWNWSIERLAYRPLRRSFRLAPLISTLGVSLFLSNLVQWLQGPNHKAIAPFFPGSFPLFKDGAYEVTLSYKQIFIISTTSFLLLLFWWMIQKTSLGRAQRACEQDSRMAALLGIDVNRTISLTFVMGAALAAVAGAFYLIYYGIISFSDGFIPGLKAFTAAVLGGIGSLPGAVLGGVVIGLTETFWAAYFSSDYKDVAALSLLILTLMFRPAGFFGRHDIEKV